MIGKILNILILLVFAVVIFSVASIAGVRNDDKKAKRLAEELEAERIAEESAPKEIASPYTPYTGTGVLDLKLDYEVQMSGSDILVSVVSNLPDGYDMSAELSNVEEVKKQLGFENVSSSALTPEQMNSINEQTYSQKGKNFVAGGVCEFTFKNPPEGQLDLRITSPITKLQPSSVQSLLGDKGANFQGDYVVYLEEMGDKSINFTASFLVENNAVGSQEPAPKQ